MRPLVLNNRPHSFDGRFWKPTERVAVEIDELVFDDKTFTDSSERICRIESESAVRQGAHLSTARTRS